MQSNPFSLWTLSLSHRDSCTPAHMLEAWQRYARAVIRASRIPGSALWWDIFSPKNTKDHLAGYAGAASRENDVNAFWFPLMPFDVIENSRTLTRAVALWDAENAWRNDAD